MSHASLAANPFALMMSPEAVFAAIEHSERLGRLNSRVCRPLDNPRPPQTAPELKRFDAEVDAAIDALEPMPVQND